METSGFAKFLVEGPRARAWLTHLTAGRLPRPGRIALAPMCNETGNLTGDLTIRLPAAAHGSSDGPWGTVTGGRYGERVDRERFIIFGSASPSGTTNAGSTQSSRLGSHGADGPASAATARGDPVRLRTLGTSLCGVAISGPKSRALLAEVTDADVSGETMPFGSFTELDIGWARALCGRLSYTGELGYELWMDAGHLQHVFNLLVAHGAAHGLRLFGLHALNSLRLDKSFGSWAREYRPTYDPFEAGLGRFVRFARASDDGTDFVGRAALINKYGLGEVPSGYVHAPADAMALRTWALDGPDDESGFDAAGDEPIYCDGEPVGWVTSGGFAHHSNVSVAMGYVPAELAHEGVQFDIEIVGERRAARLVDGCLWDPEGTAMRR